MPTYEYKCAKCKKKFDHFQRMSDPMLEKCPKCGAPKPERLIGAGAGLIFKGSGFYATDYKKSGKSKTKPEPSGCEMSKECKKDCKRKNPDK